ncbi:hypothetical protein HYV50_04945 [Candidatus Pacearchaeota archaeon]|nr:hypothetical protein [Candidatus Pacearchaeota archaeon]
MDKKYVARVNLPENEMQDSGPFYKYFCCGCLEEAKRIVLKNYGLWFLEGGGLCEKIFGLIEVNDLAVKEVGKKHAWEVLFDHGHEY